MKRTAEPVLGLTIPAVQPDGTTVRRSISLQHSEPVIEVLNQILADALTLRDLYKKHHWQASGPTFYQLHLLFDKHPEQLGDMVDLIAERIQILGGVSVAMAPMRPT
jgi:starvation-inducible DNA-binding protein